jgi:ectoine hydroxylase-related dioxygenase (phytanoyl-CoA dioxygenase family)
MKKIEQPVFRINQKLEDEHIAFFHKHGFIQFRNFIDRGTISTIINELENVQQYLLRNNIKKVNGIPLKFGHDEANRPLIQRIAFASQYSKFLSDFLKDERLQVISRLLRPYEGRIGENEKDGLVVNHYVNTAFSQFTKLGWHTDSPRDLFLGSRIRPMLNVGLHLDNCSFDNGGLRILPGTHKQSILRLLFRKKYFIDNNPDKKEIGFDIEAGDLTVHDGRLWHRVQESPYTGEKSRRRVMYIPIITGAYEPKHADSATPFYHKLAQIKLKPHLGKLNWAALRMKTATYFK